MKNRHTAARRGRGKFYHLSWLRPAVRIAMRDQLSRHADVCVRVGTHPHVAFNLTSTPVAGDEGWWVIDDWVGEQTLADHMQSGPWPADQLPRLLLEIAQGLEALHREGIVFRELAPARVLIADQDRRAVLTDFELAKLLDGSPSVSSEWPEDPYRAPEVDGGNVTIRADFYSLGKVAVAAAAGRLVDEEAVPLVLGKVGMPKRMARYFRDCLEPVPEQRPPELAPLLKELGRWAGKGTP
jgi:serine/threonine protein kinase